MSVPCMGGVSTVPVPRRGGVPSPPVSDFICNRNGWARKPASANVIGIIVVGDGFHPIPSRFLRPLAYNVHRQKATRKTVQKCKMEGAYMKKLPRRKELRLKDYDYSQPGYYFITICTKNKDKILSDIVGGGFHAAPKVELTTIGQEILNSIEFLGRSYSNVLFDKFVIMPNHIHLIIILLGSETGGDGTPPLHKTGDGTPPLHKIVGQLKSFTNKRYNEIKNNRNLVLWQRNYYERIIRNELEYREIWDYIDGNPAKWEEDEYFTTR